MPHATLHDLIVATGGRPSDEVRPGDAIGIIRTDSRLVTAGDCFWALPGSAQNGHDFVGEAIRHGARCCVVQEDRPAFVGHPRVVVRSCLNALSDFARWYRQSRDAMVIGITGSVGKTTTRMMLHAVLSERFAGAQSPANFNNHVGVPLSLLAMEPRDEFAVIEMGASGPGEIAALADIARPEAAIITTVAPAHLERFGSIEAIQAAKGELVAAIPADGFVVLNGDDRRVRAMASRAACRVIRVGEGPENDLRPDRVTVGNNVIALTIGNSVFRLRAIGRQHVASALASIAVAREIGLSDVEIARGIGNFEPAAGRCRRIEVGPWTLIDDTYNASPVAAAAAVEILRKWQTTHRKWLVLGDMLELGRDSESLHRELGSLAGRVRLDGIIAFGSFSDQVVDGARAAGMSAGQLAVCRDLPTAMLHLDCWLSPGDVVLVKGSRGMRMERIIEQLKQRVSVQEQAIHRAA